MLNKEETNYFNRVSEQARKEGIHFSQIVLTNSNHIEHIKRSYLADTSIFKVVNIMRHVWIDNPIIIGCI